MFGGEPDKIEEAPKFGAFETGSEDDGMPMANQEAELFNMNDYSQPTNPPANTYGDFDAFNTSPNTQSNFGTDFQA